MHLFFHLAQSMNCCWYTLEVSYRMLESKDSIKVKKEETLALKFKPGILLTKEMFLIYSLIGLARFLDIYFILIIFELKG